MYYLQYLRYIIIHKWYVYHEARKLGVPFLQAVRHDLSKFSWIEFDAYAKFFYVSKTDPTIKKNFKAAWQHHIHHNPHHWNYWLVNEEMGHDAEEFPAYSIPEKYVLEMIADWRGMSLTLKNGDATLWYRENQHKIILHPETRLRVHQLLGIE
jgi:hypothetical protein